uniref:Protein MON2 homolog n=1 Tax=Lutzomyia longipalpis TaxID=7200 RepID=A0A1B0CMD8_LUTLO
MSFVSGTTGSEAAKKFLEVLQNDFRQLGQETKKKYPQIKESCEEAIAKLKSAIANPQTPVYYVVNQILYPLVQGCESKDAKIIKYCLGMMQRLITQQVVDHKGARYITDTLWMLMENGIEEVKVLQTVTLLLTTNTVVHGETLAKTLVLCFRLHFTKNSTTINTAGATIRQLVSLVFERVVAEEAESSTADGGEKKELNLEELKLATGIAPRGLKPCAADAFLLFQDLVQLVNADQPYWLLGMTEMTRTFGLELLEAVLTTFTRVFKNEEFFFLLKERVCALVIKLFSPNIKYRTVAQTSNQQVTPHEKPYFPISMRLLRVVSILVQKYHNVLITECEIFLSLIVKFLDPDKPSWQRSLALEVLHKMIVQPDLLVSFCKYYDLRNHATNIFQDIINSLGAYVQSLFVTSQIMSTSSAASQPSGQVNATTLIGALPVGPGASPQPGFLFRAYACLLDIVKSISLAIQGPSQIGETNPRPYKERTTEEDQELHCQLINSSWCGLLAALSPLIDAATDEAVTENILKSMQSYAALCGILELHTPRDAFITTICRASLPPHYALSMLNTGYHSTPFNCHGRMDVQELVGTGQYMGGCGEGDFRHQVVAVGTPLPTSSLPIGVQQGPVMLTAKNLQCMRSLLHLAHCHGGLLGTSWHIVLATLQHLVWILGLKPSTGGSLQAVPKQTTDTNAVITTAVMADLPMLSQMLSQLFESSQYLDDVALHHLIDALCKLSHEAMELAYSNREPSLFAVAKLLETGVMNLQRIEVLWRPLTNHLLEVCQHPHIRMREWGVEAITYLVRTALQYKYEVPLRENQKLQTLLLSPLAELSTVPHGDVRSLDCVLQVLNGAGETLSYGWPLVLGIIGAVSDHHGEALIRIAFQCLQLVVTDFLPVMPWRCLPLCVSTAAKFGSQTQELNISLTAVGLMWNISDYFNQNQEKLSQTVTDDCTVFPDFPGTLTMPHFDNSGCASMHALGISVLTIVQPKSGGQTLFSTISAHGSLLNPPTWQAVLWQVLFPLLDNVRTLSNTASSEKVDTSGNILIHHSRNTAQKQWAETQVLTLSGVSRVFNTKRQLLQQLGDFDHGSDESSVDMWNVAWRVWLNIGCESGTFHMNTNDKSDETYFPSQAFLTALVQIFPALFQHIRPNFTDSDLAQLCRVLMNAVVAPINTDTTPYILSNMSDSPLTPLHDGILDCMELLQNEALTPNSPLRPMIPAIFKQLLKFSQFSCQPPSFGCTDDDGEREKTRQHPFHQSSSSNQEWISMNYIPFGEKSLSVVVKLYKQTASDDNVIQSAILHEIIRALQLPLSLKYKCPAASTWKQAISTLMSVLHTGLPIIRSNGKYFTDMWKDLADTLDQFLFPKSVCTIEDRGLEEIVLDEAIDCQVIELLRDEVLTFSSEIPQEFILNVVVLLNKGSIHSGCDSEFKLREEFAKTCFDTLLQFSLEENETPNANNNTTIEGGVAGRLAITALLHRFQEVLKKYNDDERQSGKCPLPRYRLTEISFVLKAVATLIVSMKKASSTKVGKTAWEQLIELYPYLVDCTTTSSAEVSRSLREALLQYSDLLQIPPITPNGITAKFEIIFELLTLLDVLLLSFRKRVRNSSRLRSVSHNSLLRSAQMRFNAVFCPRSNDRRIESFSSAISDTVTGVTRSATGWRICGSDTTACAVRCMSKFTGLRPGLETFDV